MSVNISFKLRLLMLLHLPTARISVQKWVFSSQIFPVTYNLRKRHAKIYMNHKVECSSSAFRDSDLLTSTHNVDKVWRNFLIIKSDKSRIKVRFIVLLSWKEMGISLVEINYIVVFCKHIQSLTLEMNFFIVWNNYFK